MNHVEITTYIGCPNRCSYCPQDLLIKTYKGNRSMTIKDFKKILNNIPYDVDIHFSGFSELFFHKDAIKFIKEANKNHSVVIYTTTKGITEGMIESLKSMSFKEFVVHEIECSIQLPFSHRRVKITDDNKISRGGNLYDTGKHSGRCIKSPEYKQNVVLPNGDLYLCCMDYGLKHRLGNLFKENFKNIKREKHYELCEKCEWYQ